MPSSLFQRAAALALTAAFSLPAVAAVSSAVATPQAHAQQFSSETSSRIAFDGSCLLYTSPSPRDVEESRMPSSA